MFGWGHEAEMVSAEDALPGRSVAMPVPETHQVNGHRLVPPFPEGTATAVFGMGCFWGAERLFWETEGVYSTAVGYAGGYTENPTYEETCTGLTGHTEVVLVKYDPAVVSYEQLLRIFWEGHDPTQVMRQGNDVGTQYRSAVYTVDDAQAAIGERSARAYGAALAAAGLGEISTEVAPLTQFYYAEGYHQQYLAKVPGGYCGIGGTGVRCPAGTGVGADS
ncbi:peptide-methionine (S)-S-oxide reductase MsrA [Pseudonocardia nantongensis]|uniref:peptide-methionine (S)-S-oxide reductase MsrA n=1 Tax=Pseudonocardia nantongensis TaxID=1181885 RepID=UPI00397B415B